MAAIRLHYYDYKWYGVLRKSVFSAKELTFHLSASFFVPHSTYLIPHWRICSA